MSQSADVTRLLLSIATMAFLAVGSTAADAADIPSSKLPRWIDEQMERHWKNTSLMVPLCNDGTFLRRVYLDLIGRIPSVSETRDFVKDTSTHKRHRVVDHLLAGEEDKDVSEMVSVHLARILGGMMIPLGSNGAPMGSKSEPWLREQFREKTGYDEIARRLVTAHGNESPGCGLQMFLHC